MSYSQVSIDKYLANKAAGKVPTSPKWTGIEVHGDRLFKDGKQIIPVENANAVLQELYDDPATGLKSYRQLWQTVKEKYIGINSKTVQRFTASQQTEQVQRPVIKAKVNKPIIKSAPNQQFNMDLIDMSGLAGLNNNVHFLLTVIDAFSKKAWVYPLKTKEEGGVRDALKALFDSEGKPLVIVSDNGSEFISKAVNALLDEYEVRHIYTKAYSPQSNAQVERFNKTIKTKIYKFMEHYNTQHYLDALPKLVANYNDTVHSVTKRKPDDLHALGNSNPRAEKKVAPEVQEQFDEAKAGIEKQATKWLDKTDALPLKDNIKMGDYVRIAEGQKPEVKKNKIFRKSYERQWSAEIYQVAWVNYADKTTIPDSYTLVSPEGEILSTQYYRDHLQKVKPNEIKTFNGVRPDFSEGKVFNREKFLQKEMPAIKEAKPIVEIPAKEPRITRAKAKKEVVAPAPVVAPEPEPVVRRSGRERKAVQKYGF